MAQVLVLDSLDDIFICGVCKANYNALHLFLEHKRICEGTDTVLPKARSNQDVLMKCDDAMKPQPPETLINGEDCSNSPTCTLCKKTFRKIKSLNAHMKAHEEKPYQCLICGRCFAHNSYLQRHITSHKIWPDANSETVAKPCKAELLSYICHYCDTVLSNYILYRSHLKKHQDLKKIKCIQDECKDSFDSFEEIIHHVSCTHTMPIYSCHICSDTFRSLKEIALHQKVHEQDKASPLIQSKQFKCSLCDAIFKKSDKLSLHMLTDNHKKVCMYCKKTFTSNKRLRLHLQLHQQLKPYQCTVCDSTFHMKKYLSTHMLRHGKSQFKCTICKTLFKRQDLLQRHMKLHQTINLYKCPFRDTLDCKKEFSRSDKLKSHIKIHTKHVSYSASKTRLGRELNTGTVEICIVPLDTKRNDN